MTPKEAVDDQMSDPLFICATCEAAVIIYGGNQFHTCPHLDDAVVVTQRGMNAALQGLEQ